MPARLATTIGSHARHTRLARGWSQADVAERLDLSLEFYGRLERGVALPSIETLVKLADVLGTRPDALLGFEARNATQFSDAPAQAPAPALPPPGDPVLARRLRRASPTALRFVRELLGAFERAEGRARRVARR